MLPFSLCRCTVTPQIRTRAPDRNTETQQHNMDFDQTAEFLKWTADNPPLKLIRSYTRAAPSFIKNPIISVLGSKKCYESLIEDINYKDTECLKLAVSKGLGVGIVAGGSIVKIPQILKIINSGSGEGVSVASYILETASFLITLGYNVRSGFPFSTYGETVFIAIQNVFITLLVLHYSRKTAFAGLVVLALSAGLYALFSTEGVSFKTLQYLQTMTIPIALGSKIPQIMTIARNKSTGQLSAFAVFNYLIGSLARIYTTLTEVDDPLIFWGFMLSTILNAVLVVQMIYYWNSPAAKVKTK